MRFNLQQKSWTLCLHGIFFTVLLSMHAWAKSPSPVSVAWDTAPRSYDPRYAIDADSQYLENLLHCSLIEFNEDGAIKASLAQKWHWKDSKTLEIKLKTDAKFGDGSSVTSEDVKATYNFFLSKQSQPSPRALAFNKIQSIEAKGSTILIKLKEADASFISNLAVGILPKKYATKKIDAKTKLAGCGPFILDKVHFNNLYLKRNEHYTLSSKAKSELINIKIIKDENTRFLKLRKGSVDISQNNISLDKIEKLSTYPNLKVQRRSSLKTSYIGFNTKDGYLKHRKVRAAIAKAINRDVLIKYLLKGYATKANSILPPNNSYYNKKLAKSVYDPKTANKLLDEAGFKAKQGYIRFQLSYKTTNNATRLAIARSIASDLKKIGIKVHVQSLEWGRFKEDVDKGRVQMWGLSWIGFKDPNIFWYAFHSDNVPPNGANRGRFANPQLDKLLQLGQVETKFAKRSQYYDKVQELVGKEHPYAFLFHEENFAVTRKDVKGFKVFADGRYASLKDTYK